MVDKETLKASFLRRSKGVCSAKFFTFHFSYLSKDFSCILHGTKNCEHLFKYYVIANRSPDFLSLFFIGTCGCEPYFMNKMKIFLF